MNLKNFWDIRRCDRDNAINLVNEVQLTWLHGRLVVCIPVWSGCGFDSSNKQISLRHFSSRF